MLFILINAFLVVIIIICLIILSFVWPPDSPWSPWWRTNGRKAKAAAKLASITKVDMVFELGSGDATFLVVTAKRIGAKCVGIEIDPIRHIIAKLNVIKNGVGRKVSLYRGNFFDYKLTRADVVFVYLVPRVLEKLKPKLFKELKKGARIVSYKYKFADEEPSLKSSDGQSPKLKYVSSDKKNGIHLYKIV